MKPERPAGYWFKMDWSTEHSIILSSENPGPEWEGPYRTFTEVRKIIVGRANDRMAAIQGRRDWWRNTRKNDILAAVLVEQV